MLVSEVKREDNPHRLNTTLIREVALEREKYMQTNQMVSLCINHVCYTMSLTPLNSETSSQFLEINGLQRGHQNTAKAEILTKHTWELPGN